MEEAGEEFPPPKEFQTALAVAYRFRAVAYRDHTEFALEAGSGFEGIDDILHIAVRGPLVRKLQGNDLVLSSAYQDYDDLCDLVREGNWDQSAWERLQQLLNRYNSAYLQEKCSGNPEKERNVVSLRLLEAFFTNEPLPEDAYEVLWNAFDLNTAVMGRAKILYGRLREIVMEKAPEVCGQRERFVELRTAYSNLGADVHAAGRGGFLGGTSRGGSVCGPGGFSPRHPKPPLCPERDYPSLVQLVFQSIPSPEIVGHLRG